VNGLTQYEWQRNSRSLILQIAVPGWPEGMKAETAIRSAACMEREAIPVPRYLYSALNAVVRISTVYV
jgi:hypothetical protein